MTHTYTTLRSMVSAALLAALALMPAVRAQQRPTTLASAAPASGRPASGAPASAAQASGAQTSGTSTPTTPTPGAQPPATATPATTPAATGTRPAPMPAPVSAPSPSATMNLPSEMTCAELPRIVQEITRAKTRLDDWAQLARFREANLELPAAAAGQPRVVFMGDSITDGWDDPRYGGFFPGKAYINRGISGQTTPQMVLRMRADVLAHKPKVIVLLAGTNDIAGNTGPMTVQQTEDNIATIAELSKLHGVKVVLSSILPTSDYHFKGDSPLGPQTVRRPLAKIRAINDWMQAYAKANGHVYLDYYSAAVDAQGMLKTELSEDDLHPNAAGYAIMGPLAAAAIERALSSPGR